MTQDVEPATALPSSRYVRWRDWVNRKLNPGDGDSKAVDSFIILLISLNVLAVMAETAVPPEEQGTGFFRWFDTVSSIVFSFEYVGRVWVAPLWNPGKYKRPILGRLRYMFTVMALVDLIAILPFFLQFIEMDTRIARAIRMFRLVRILKMGRYAHAVRTLAAVFARKKEELAIVTFVLVMLLILCSSAIFFVENPAPDNQPNIGADGIAGTEDDFEGRFTSIPDSMWWSVVTITSVGYGDVSPTTQLGKIVGGIICLVGVLFIALPTGILSAGFLEQMRETKLKEDADSLSFHYCPHCGEQLNPFIELE